jgi:hypothetical protein
MLNGLQVRRSPRLLCLFRGRGAKKGSPVPNPYVTRKGYDRQQKFQPAAFAEWTGSIQRNEVWRAVRNSGCGGELDLARSGHVRFLLLLGEHTRCFWADARGRAILGF